VLPRDLDGRAAGDRDRDAGEWRADAADRTRPA